MRSSDGQVVLLTGAAGGIGGATAQSLASTGDSCRRFRVCPAGEALAWLHRRLTTTPSSSAISSSSPSDSLEEVMSADHPRSYESSVPKLAELGRDVLFGDVWERPGLGKRDRSLITVAALVATYRPGQMPFHMNRALENGVTREELVELITHLAFYAGWPSAVSAADILGQVFDAQPNEQG